MPMPRYLFITYCDQNFRIDTTNGLIEQVIAYRRAGGNTCFKVLSEYSAQSPLSQFEIRDLLSIDFPIFGDLHLSITNIGLYLMLGAFFILTLNLLSTNYNRLVGNS